MEQQNFRSHYPAVTLGISATDRMIDLVPAGIDAVVRLAVLEDSDLICRKIGDVPILTCGGGNYIACHGMPKTPADLTDHHLVNYALRIPAPSAEWDGLEDGHEIFVAMQSHLCVDNTESYVAGALYGHGLIQVPEHDVADDITAGRLTDDNLFAE